MTEPKDILAGTALDDDIAVEPKLRPQTLSEYIGQTCTLNQYLATGASCGGTRTALGNWDTRITEVGLGGSND